MMKQNISAFRKILRLILAAYFVAPHNTAYAAKIRVERNVLIRTAVPSEVANENPEMLRVGQLTKGSIVEIPDEFIVQKDGKPDFELSLNEWLKRAGELRSTGDGAPVQGRFDGDRSEFFFPVKLLHAAPGSTIREGFENIRFYMALQNLVRQGNSLKITNEVEIAKQSKISEEEAEAEETSRESTTSTEAGTCNGSCGSDQFVALQKDLSHALNLVQSAVTKKTDAFTALAPTVAQDFQSKCGMDLKQFEKTLDQETSSKPEYKDVLLSIMVNESAGAGLCRAINSADKNGGSWGLFQINAGSSSYAPCKTLGNIPEKDFRVMHASARGRSTAQETAARKEYVNAYNQCRAYLSDPVNNLKEALRVIKGKENFLFNGKFDVSRLSTADRLRLVVSAYNGGEGNVDKARQDLIEFNKRHGTTLDHHNWEDLRVFYLRTFLSIPQAERHIGKHVIAQSKKTKKYYVSGRGRDNTLINLAYIETLFPRKENSIRSIEGGYIAFETKSEDENVIAANN